MSNGDVKSTVITMQNALIAFLVTLVLGFGWYTVDAFAEGQDKNAAEIVSINKHISSIDSILGSFKDINNIQTKTMAYGFKGIEKLINEKGK